MPTASVTYVDGQLTMKANQATTYTKTETDNMLTPKATVTYVDNQAATEGKSIYNLHQNRNS